MQLATLMRPADSTNPSFNVRRALTTVLGMPLAPADSQKQDATGSLGFYFHEGTYKNGEPSPRVFGVSCDHVLRDDTSVDYEYAGERTGARKQDVRVCGYRSFQELLDKTRDLLADKVEKTVDLATEIADLEEEQKKIQDDDEAQEAAEALKRKKEDLARFKQDSVTLEKHLRDVFVDWRDIKARSVGHVDYAPSINGEGGGLALLHSGMPRGMHNHVTFGTPLWWVIDQILRHYPNAIFDRTTF